MALKENGGTWFVLMMSDMRHQNAANVRSVARARSVEELEQLLGRERRERYLDGSWSKAFREGGPLEWKHDPAVSGLGGVVEVYALAAREGVQLVNVRTVIEIPTVEQLDAQHAQGAQEGKG